MNKIHLFVLFLFLRISISPGQIEIPFVVTDGTNSILLHAGLYPSATDGVDPDFSEVEFPPLPPTPSYEARFIGDDIGISQLGGGVRRDFRKGNSFSLGTRTHELEIQSVIGRQITIQWNLPLNVRGMMLDISNGATLCENMKGLNSFTFQNTTQMSKIKIILTYGVVEYFTPVNQDDFVSKSPILFWGKVHGATFYRLRLATDSTFAATIYNDFNIEDTTQQIGPLEFVKTYYWKVDARNSSDTIINSTVWRFKTRPYPNIAIDRATIDFGMTKSKTTSSQIINITNSSLTDLNIDSTVASSPFFEITPHSAVIRSTDTLKLIIKFNPKLFQHYSDTLKIWNNSQTAVIKIPIIGSSPAPTISCSSKIIFFDEIGIYDSSKIILKITNNSINTLAIDSIYTHSSNFIFSPSTIQITNNDTGKITVLFKPIRFGDYLDTLFLKNNSDTALIAILLKGKTPASTISVTPASLAFGTVRKDSTKQLQFVLTNSSISILQIDSLWTKTKYFNVAHTLAVAQIKKGDSSRITIRFTPDTSRLYLDTLLIANNSFISPSKVLLNGNGTLTLIGSDDIVSPTAYELHQNYPNPFNPTTTIRYAIPITSKVKLTIFNALGQSIEELVNTEQTAGWYEIVWSAKISSGLYFYRLEATGTDNLNTNFLLAKKMLLLK